MKTRTSQRILLIVGLSALLTNPTFAAFGDSTSPAPSSLSGNGAAGSALPPGTYPSSPSDADSSSRKNADSKPAAPVKKQTGSHPKGSSKTQKKAPVQSGS